jgi:hypothetical protein
MRGEIPGPTMSKQDERPEVRHFDLTSVSRKITLALSTNG